MINIYTERNLERICTIFEFAETHLFIETHLLSPIERLNMTSDLKIRSKENDCHNCSLTISLPSAFQSGNRSYPAFYFWTILQFLNTSLNYDMYQFSLLTHFTKSWTIFDPLDEVESKSRRLRTKLLTL